MFKKLMFWIYGMKEYDMNWVFVCSKGDAVDYVKIFNDYFDGADYADAYIKRHDNDAELPNYRANEFYRTEQLTVSLIRETANT